MRRLIVLTSTVMVICLASSRHAVAQELSKPNATPHISLGGFWSANVATVSYAPRPNGIEAQQWVGVGATGDVPMNQDVSLDVRAMWNRKGARLTLASNFVSRDSRRLPLDSRPIQGGLRSSHSRLRRCGSRGRLEARIARDY
jgi:hypothetical protein